MMRGTGRNRSLWAMVLGIALAGVLVTPSIADHTQFHTAQQIDAFKTRHATQADRLKAQRSTIREIKQGLAALEGGPVAGANVADDGTVRSFFNNVGGAPTVDHIGPGRYTITFPGLEGQVAFDNAVALVSLQGISAGLISRSAAGSDAHISTFDEAGVLTDTAWEIVVFLPGAP